MRRCRECKGNLGKETIDYCSYYCLIFIHFPNSGPVHSDVRAFATPPHKGHLKPSKPQQVGRQHCCSHRPISQKKLPRELQARLERQVPAAAADPQLVLAGVQPPGLGGDVPAAQVPPGQLELDRGLGAGLERRLGEAAQLADGRALLGDADVELRRLGARHVARVGHLCRDARHHVEQVHVPALLDRAR
ncbi:hypothetical protein PoMZ_01659, partial [Pyricularia oryzae]